MERDMKEVIRYWMQGEINSFIKVWISAYLSLCYCYFSGKVFPKGAARLAAFLPVVCLFLLLPLQLHSTLLTGTTSFFLSWLATFKLLMFAFDQGPLSSPSISLPRFIAVGCLPIKLQEQNPSPKSKENGKTPSQIGHKSFSNYAIKALLFTLLLKVYDYEDSVPRGIIRVLHTFHIYLTLELILAIAAAMARGLLAAELEPQFHEPYLSTSLQDFWGRRWNLMVTRVLRPTVYLPVLTWSDRILGRRWAPLPAVMSTFVVSGLMHELILYYLGRMKPTGVVTCFFLLHGVCLVAEIAVKKAVDGRWRLPRIVARILTVGFVVVTGLWLFIPQLLRFKADEKGLGEVAAVGAFVTDVVGTLKSTNS